MFRHEKKGFTLIELLVVIAIIGTLASVVLASLNSARVKARNAAMETSVMEIRKGLELYFFDNNRYPQSTSWDCLGDTTRASCWYSTSANFFPSNNHLQISNLNQFVNHSAMSIPEQGILYSHRESGAGYEMIYLLEGRRQQCGAGFNRVLNQSSSGNTSCTVCGNYTDATWCVDRF